MTTSVCLVGHRRLFRAGLKHLLNCEAFDVVLEVDICSELPDVAWKSGIFIFDMPSSGDVEHDLRLMKRRFPDSRIVVLAEAMKVEELALSFSAGVDGYLLAEISPEALRESLQLVMLGEKVFPSRLVTLLCGEHPIQQLSAENGNFLSDREVAVVSRLAGGLPNKVIASQLTITEATVKVHLKSILKKLGVSNRTQAAIWAVNNGMAGAPTYLQ
jgi:two-component system, NarL family, nitrate/nitrite response regulator NarL